MTKAKEVTLKLSTTSVGNEGTVLRIVGGRGGSAYLWVGSDATDERRGRFIGAAMNRALRTFLEAALKAATPTKRRAPSKRAARPKRGGGET